MKRIGLCAALAVALITVSAPAASATPVAIGDPMATGSWAQTFNESGVGLFNRMQVFMLSGAGFEAPAFSAFGGAGWLDHYVNPTYAWASGSAISNMNFNLNFLGSSADPLSFVFVAWNNNVRLEAALAVWNGGWSISPYSGALPAPDGGTTLALLGCALVGLGALRRKFGL